MKTTKRFLYGVISSLLLSVGFVQAANELDPMNMNGEEGGATVSVATTESCTIPCDVNDPT